VNRPPSAGRPGRPSGPEHHAAALGSGWVWPWWLERQLDPTGPDFQPAPGRPPENVTHRSWTTTGSLAAPDRAAVDPRGLVSVVAGAGGWSLDWWIGAEDRWHFPSRATSVRQALVDGTPVVETRLRIPGGDAIARAYGAQASGPGGGDPLAVLEIENDSAVPVALALVIRPAGPAGLGAVGSVQLDGSEVWVDDQLGLLLPRPPTRVGFADGACGDLAEQVVAGIETAPGDDGGPTGVRCPEGCAQAAFVYPLPHTAVLRVALPLRPPDAGRRGARSKRTERSERTDARAQPALPEAERVARGWEAQSHRGLRCTLPAGRLADVVSANRRFLLLATSGEDLAGWPAPRFRFADAAVVLATLGQWGFGEDVERLLGAWPDRQALDGWFGDADGRVDATGAALWAIGNHWRLTREERIVESLLGPVAKGVHALGKRLGGRRRDERERGLLPGGPGPAWAANGPGLHYQDDAWAWAGLLAAAEVMDPIGQPEVAAQARQLAGRLADDLRASMAAAAARAGGGAAPAGPHRRLDGGVVANLVACEPLGLLGADDPVSAATLDLVRDRYTADAAVVQAVGPAGLSPLLTAWLAGAEVAAADRRALARLDWLVGAASPTCTWPEVVHPRTGGGAAGDGHHAATGAAFLRLVRQVLVREAPDGLTLCSVLPAGWAGQGLEVHDAPTAWGSLSYGVRWHGERPALLWELTPHDADGEAPVLRAPGLDPTWHRQELRGEALLAPFELLDGTDGDDAPDPGGSFR
jgi:hypothetical protein